MAEGPGSHDRGGQGLGDDRLRDAERLRSLEARLATVRRDDRPSIPGGDKFAGANQAWRMVVELVAGLAIGFGAGLGLDWLFGTRPVMLVLFTFLGFAAGVKTMLRTAAEMARTATDTGATPAGGPPAGQEPGTGPDGTKGTTRGN